MEFIEIFSGFILTYCAMLSIIVGKLNINYSIIWKEVCALRHKMEN